MRSPLRPAILKVCWLLDELTTALETGSKPSVLTAGALTGACVDSNVLDIYVNSSLKTYVGVDSDSSGDSEASGSASAVSGGGGGGTGAGPL